MCPLAPFHVIILYFCLILPLLFAVIEGADELAGLKLPRWNLQFTPDRVEKLKQFNLTEVNVTLNCTEHCDSIDDPGSLQHLRLVLTNEKENIASLQLKEQENDREIFLNVNDLEKDDSTQSWMKTMFSINGKFLGFTNIKAELKDQRSSKILAEKTMKVSVVRKKTIQSKLFSYSVAILVSLAYINMGCAMDLEVVKKTLKKPVGPLIGFICQYFIMPLISYALGYIFGAKNAPMRLGLFVTGCSPGGGASNIWTVMFGGNLDLSVTMTAVSTFSAFFMMPLWIFTLGSTIFNESDIVIPYYKICIYAFFLVIPLSIGLALQRWAPKVSNFMVKILKPMALFLILFIIIFGVWANLYIFEMMTWQVLLSGMGLPWIGFSFGFVLAKLLKRPMEDIIAIAIETGIQNTGMSIFILWLTLDHPLGDMAAVIPVAAAIMTPVPLLTALIIMKVRDVCTQKSQILIDQDSPLDSEDSHDKKGSIVKTSRLEGEDPENESRCPLRNIFPDEVKDSESKMKLVGSDANENIA